jgi:hypothetical protein
MPMRKGAPLGEEGAPSVRGRVVKWLDMAVTYILLNQSEKSVKEEGGRGATSQKGRQPTLRCATSSKGSHFPLSTCSYLAYNSSNHPQSIQTCLL